jgi:dihydrofolate synthase/folylpolyglutamate synthase
VNFEQALRELDARQPERMIPDLSRIRAVAELMDNPQLTYPTIHVTGTNGKTTTARIATAVTCSHGISTGTYTSPHLESVTERISLCGEPIEEEEFAQEYERLLPYLREIDALDERVTYFETLTALAYLWFADKPAGLGVFEVGMGGVWDATNLISGDVAVICPISLDHPELGSTVAEVATEKAGIIKAGRVAVCREQPAEAMAVIETRAREVDAKLFVEGRDFSVTDWKPAVEGQLVSIRAPQGAYQSLHLPLFGDHAARNAAAALTAVEALLDRPLSEDSVRSAMAGVTSPGRLEVIARHPLVVVDGAHNPGAAQALASALPEAFTWKRLHLVVAGFGNHDTRAVIQALAPLADLGYAAANTSPRSRPSSEIEAAMTGAGLDVGRFATVESALGAAMEAAGAGDLILVTGSLYTVADARRVIHSHG